jgi:hypothetical protein
LSQCPQFVSGPETEFAAQGTARHKAFKFMLENPDMKDCPANIGDVELTPEDREGIEWAVEYVRVNAPMSDHPLELEVKRSFTGPNFEQIEGTPDVVCGNTIFDLKWRRDDYDAQMAGYSLMLEAYTVDVHILFAESKTVRRLVFSGDDAERKIFPAIEAAGQGEAKSCDYCGWCAKQLTCSAHVENAEGLSQTRDDVKAEDAVSFSKWIAGGAHASELKTPELAGAALRIARTLSKWCEAVEHFARELATKEGKVPAGFKLQERKGNRTIPDINAAFARAGLPQKEFLEACEIKFSALAEKHATLNGMKKAGAEKDMEARLGDALQRKPSTVSLVAANADFRDRAGDAAGA